LSTEPITASVIFCSSPPRNPERLALARKTLNTVSTINLMWPREVPARRPGDPRDYLAGTDQLRVRDLVDFLTSDQELAWFGRGGYGVTRLLAHLDERLASVTVSKPKRWVGYSDLSALFAYAHTKGLPVRCIHGPMVCAYPEQPNREEIEQALRGCPVPIPVRLESPEATFNGPIWGGNLAVLASLCGTPWLPRLTTPGAIFLEDIDEAPYRLDRYLTQLYDSGFFAHRKQLFLGTFTGFQPAELALQTVVDRCHELGLTVVGHLPVGHSEPHCPLFLETPYILNSELGLLEPAPQ